MSSVSQNKIADDGDHARNSNDAETHANGCVLAQNPERDNGSDTRKPSNRADSLRPCCRTAVVAGRISPLILDCVHNNMFLSNTSNARCRLTLIILPAVSISKAMRSQDAINRTRQVVRRQDTTLA